METFLTVILFIFVGFWLLGLFGRWTLRWWLARKQREFQQQFGGADTAGGGTGRNSGSKGSFRGFYANFGNPSARQRRRWKEGEVTVTRTAMRSERQVAKSVGEYVEYEEVESTVSTTTVVTDRQPEPTDGSAN